MNNTNDPQIKYGLRTVSIKILEGLNQFHVANLALISDEDQATFGKVTNHYKQPNLLNIVECYNDNAVWNVGTY